MLSLSKLESSESWWGRFKYGRSNSGFWLTDWALSQLCRFYLGSLYRHSCHLICFSSYIILIHIYIDLLYFHLFAVNHQNKFCPICLQKQSQSESDDLCECKAEGVRLVLCSSPPCQVWWTRRRLLQHSDSVTTTPKRSSLSTSPCLEKFSCRPLRAAITTTPTSTPSGLQD